MATGAVVFFEDFVVTTLSLGGKAYEYAVNTMCTNRRGNIYRVQTRGNKNELVAVDSVGNEFIKQSLHNISNVEDYLVTTLYTTNNGIILVGAVTRNCDTEVVSEITLHRYYEDGTYGGKLLTLPCEQNVSAAVYTGVRFSEFFEKDGKVYFGLLHAGKNKNQVDVYAMDSDNSSIPEKVADYPDPGYVSFMPLDGVSAVGALPNGKLEMLSSKKTHGIDLGKDVVIGRIWGSDGEIYIQDLSDRDIYSMKLSDESTKLFLDSESKILEIASGNLPLWEADLICVSPGARITALKTNKTDADIFTGGITYLRLLEKGKSSFNRGYFWIGAIVVGVILLSILAWDIYVEVFKMRVSIMVKQAVVVPFFTMLLLYGLLRGVLKPNINKMLYLETASKMQSASQTLCAALNLQNTNQLFRNLQIQSPAPKSEPLHYELLVRKGDEWYLEASSDGVQANTNADCIPWRISMSPIIELSMSSNTQIRSYENLGKRFYHIVSLNENQVLITSVNLYHLDRVCDVMIAQSSMYLAFAGGIMIAVLLLLEYALARSLHKLKHGVDAVSAGAYDVLIHISSGDEVEGLANSFNVMTDFIRSQMVRMEQMNEMNYRFVPRALLRLLGETHIERIGKDTHIKCHMTVLQVRFYALGKEPKNTDQLFVDINRTLEQLTPAVAKNGGTLYDFDHDGFCAVFEGEEEQALRAALQIREAAMKQLSDDNDQSAMDVRVALVTGDVMLGVIGNDERLQPTAVSEEVKIANELIALCLNSNIYVICADESVKQLHGYRCRDMGFTRLADGQKVPLYDLYDGDPFALRKHKQSVDKAFSSAVSAFYNRDFERSRALFMQILKLSMDDAGARGYLYLADRYCIDGCDDPVFKPFI